MVADPSQVSACHTTEYLVGGTAYAPPSGGYGQVSVRRCADGRILLGEADPIVAMSLGLMFAGSDEHEPRWLAIRDGLVCITGEGPDGQPREVRYRPIGFRACPDAELAAAEGGYVVLERIA